MRIVKVAMIALFTTAAFVACKKDKTENPAEVIEGRFVGKYGYGNDVPTIYFSLNFKPNGVIEEITSTGEVKGTGTYEMTGNTITAHYSWLPSNPTTFSIVAAFDPASGKLLGNWGWGSSATDGGLWEMTKQ